MKIAALADSPLTGRLKYKSTLALKRISGYPFIWKTLRLYQYVSNRARP
jgi:hypothetical protein